VESPGLIAAFEAFTPGILQHLGPHRLSLPYHHRISVFHYFFRMDGRVTPPHYYRDTSTAELSGNLVSPVSSAAGAGDAHLVIGAMVGDGHEAVIYQVHLHPLGGEGRQVREGNP
jgi:hypothetical protein